MKKLNKVLVLFLSIACFLGNFHFSNATFVPEHTPVQDTLISIEPIIRMMLLILVLLSLITVLILIILKACKKAEKLEKQLDNILELLFYLVIIFSNCYVVMFLNFSFFIVPISVLLIAFSKFIRQKHKKHLAANILLWITVIPAAIGLIFLMATIVDGFNYVLYL